MGKQIIKSLQESNNIKSLEELKEWIRLECIDISRWGTENAKTINDLWYEIKLGEAKILNKPPLRLLSVVKLLIYQDKKVLMERKQILRNSRVRSRNLPPGEKIRFGEDYRDAIKRCLWEELNISTINFEIVESTHRITHKLKISSSYPNLKTLYTFHLTRVNVAGLPQEDFWTKEVDQEGFSIVEQHYWVWHEHGLRS
jgi:hypothetical protein